MVYLNVFEDVITIKKERNLKLYIPVMHFILLDLVNFNTKCRM